ncbi:hypothetical protein XA68_10967 [Ophiocordyceps unilateralis]|uniref:Structure-specific endonuclease subunit SLX4 n=1 Tax=Ophiocordyceps unilateralis TaxID=268505 RepID=A0A2A9PPI2_OPHUN|nr:hypothetical protein XA68_10967 [Ophiocordyceps unilateralis]
MSSPDVFITSSPRARRQALTSNVSSSPGLPSLQDILSQKPHRPPLRTTRLSKNASRTSTSASRPWRSPQAEDSAQANAYDEVAALDAVEDIDTSFSVIEVPPESLGAGGEAGRQKEAGPKRAETPKGPSTPTNSRVDSQPWKKYKSPRQNSEPTAIQSNSAVEDHLCPERASADTGNCSRYFVKPNEPAKMAKASKSVQDEPLNLEAAMTRRTDWTPPIQRARIVLESDVTSNVNTVGPSQEYNDQVGSFETVLASFRCETMQTQAGSSTADDSGFLKKRKLLELVPTNAGAASESCNKRKVPRKKTRTITEIATAAYRPATQPDAAAGESQARDAAQDTGTVKRKTKPRKGISKTSKKKEVPPKPILLSPEAALRQVAHQDFLFGTSSQLAREQSPSSTSRAAMKDLTHMDLVDLRTPINSDSIEPAEQRQMLWDAAARDEDGDLFDVEVGLLADGPPELAEVATEADPFGYVRCDNPVTVSLPSLAGTDEARDDESSASLPDLVPARPGQSMRIVDQDVVMCGSEQDVISMVLPSEKLAAETQPADPEEEEDERTQAADTQEDRAEPQYELYTDAQLAKQVAQYGFKPVKKRAAMISLLNRCRPGTGPPGQYGLGATFGTTAVPSGSRSASTLAVKKKRVSGRTKATNISGKEAQGSATEEKRTRRRSREVDISDEELLMFMVPARRRRSQSRSIAVSISDEESKVLQEPTKGKQRQSRSRTGSVCDEKLQILVPPTKDKEKRTRGRSRSVSVSDKDTRETAEPAIKGKRRRSRSTADSVNDEELETLMAPTKGKRPRGRSKAASNSDEEIQGSIREVVKKKRGRSQTSKTAADGRQRQKQPPPSAQATSSPRKRKSAASKPSAKKPARKAAPAKTKRRSKSPRRTLEIADSQSDSASDSSDSSDSSLGFGLSADETELTLTMSSPTDQQRELFTHISKAVTTAPRTREPTQPSWHEKILLYDPIVLEDLTAWLNSGQLTRVGLDEEVSPAEVKAWCESKSICCVWRMSLHGKVRKRY